MEYIYTQVGFANVARSLGPVPLPDAVPFPRLQQPPMRVDVLSVCRLGVKVPQRRRKRNDRRLMPHSQTTVAKCDSLRIETS